MPSGPSAAACSRNASVVGRCSRSRPACTAIGFIAFGLAPSWELFLLAALPAGLGAGALDGGGNGLVLDLYRSGGRGRALNILHVCFSVGALTAPLAVGRLIEGGVPWPTILLGTGLAALGVAALFLTVPMPHGRTATVPRDPADERSADAAHRRSARPAADPPGRRDLLLRRVRRSACRTGWSGSSSRRR